MIVYLVGMPGSGKSTVGRELAGRLGVPFVDLDVEIERREGRTIGTIVEAEGENYLRGLESALTAELSRERKYVLAPGGGWITNPSLLEGLGPGTLAVWLMVSPPEVVRRLREDEIDRPFRDDPDPTSKIEAMLADREPLYRLADLAIPTDHLTPDEIAAEIERNLSGS